MHDASLSDDKPIKVRIIDRELAMGVDAGQESRLREASWALNELTVEVPADGREASLRFLGGRWIEC